MPLPADFSPWQHLHEMLVNAHNRNVRNTFFDTPDDDLTSSFGGMKIACLMDADDTVDMTLLRLMLFYFVFEGKLPTPVYAMPIADYQAEVTFRPQVHLWFEEVWTPNTQNEWSPIRSRVSFRLMNETSQTINPQKAQSLALRVKEFLGAGHGFKWERGPVKVTYLDKENGFDFRLLVISEGEAVRVIEAVLAVAQKGFNEQFVTVHNARRSFPSSTGSQEVYGKVRQKPRQRPTVQVQFRKAELHVYGIAKPILLVSHFGLGKPLVTF